MIKDLIVTLLTKNEAILSPSKHGDHHSEIVHTRLHQEAEVF